MENEQVLACPVEALRPFLRHGRALVTGPHASFVYRDICLTSTFVDRELAEKDETLRQIIPYILVQSYHTEDFLLMTRKPSQTEERLHGKDYLGVGGHVNPTDEEGIDKIGLSQVLTSPYCRKDFAIRHAASREVYEEIGKVEFTPSDIRGIIIASESSVDRTHVGILFHHIINEDNPEIKSEEAEKHKHRWTDYINLPFGNLETWSAIVVSKFLHPATLIQNGG